jgi:hypothetical protein
MARGPAVSAPGSVWAVARNTFTRCLRMKLALAFIVLLAIALVALPFILQGDGTLAGRLRTLLSYGVNITGVLLTVMTVFASAAVVAFDVQDRQIFTLATKPLSRGQYLLGRWLGVVMLDAVLLGIAAAGIYGVAQYMRGGEALSLADRRTVESEVFAARREVRPDLDYIERRVMSDVEAELQRLREDGRYEDAVRELQDLYGLSRGEAERRLRRRKTKEATDRVETVAPGRARDLLFTGLNLQERAYEGGAEVTGVWNDGAFLRLEADELLLARLVEQGPVHVEGQEGAVVELRRDRATIRFVREIADRPAISRIEPGDEVRLKSPPTIQLRYTTTPMTNRPVTLRSGWVLTNPTTGFVFQRVGEDPIDMASTLSVLSRVVDENGEMRGKFWNLANQSVELRIKDVSVLYRAGGFEGNFLRAILLMFQQLVFVAALGVMAASWVSFPVACLICFVILPFGLARSFLARAVDQAEDLDALMVFGDAILTGMKILLPDLEKTSPSEPLSAGRLIPWSVVGKTAVWTVLVRTGAAVLLAWLIFRRRELARVQV